MIAPCVATIAHFRGTKIGIAVTATIVSAPRAAAGTDAVSPGVGGGVLTTRDRC
jgi:hypothetical protein